MLEIKHKTYIKAKKEDVYIALTTADGWNAWFTDDTILEIHSDGTGEILIKWKNYGSDNATVEDGGKILKSVLNKKFVFQWSPGEGYSTVSFTLEPYKEGTLVVLHETGYSTSNRDMAACIGCAVGWGEALTLLKVYLEHGIVYKEDLH
ncbi:SRPBCC family protein [Fredinandcohnia humi]